jgi:hypothetical protein
MSKGQAALCRLKDRVIVVNNKQPHQKRENWPSSKHKIFLSASPIRNNPSVSQFKIDWQFVLLILLDIKELVVVFKEKKVIMGMILS